MMRQFRDLMIGLVLAWVLVMGLFDARAVQFCEPRRGPTGHAGDQCTWSLGWVRPPAP